MFDLVLTVTTNGEHYNCVSVGIIIMPSAEIQVITYLLSLYVLYVKIARWNSPTS